MELAIIVFGVFVIVLIYGYLFGMFVDITEDETKYHVCLDCGFVLSPTWFPYGFGISCPQCGCFNHTKWWEDNGTQEWRTIY